MGVAHLLTMCSWVRRTGRDALRTIQSWRGSRSSASLGSRLPPDFLLFCVGVGVGNQTHGLVHARQTLAVAWTNIPPSLQWVSEFLIGFFFYFSNNLFVCILLLNVQEHFNAKSYLCLTKAHISHNIFVLIRCKINFTSCLIWNVMDDIYAIRGMSSISVIFFFLD